MQNLAGNADCDKIILSELKRCGIPALQIPERTRSEVPYTYVGKAGAFDFRRAWYYWCVDGRVPLAVAQEMYDTEVGKRDIRVAGHCGCPPPIEWAYYYNEAGQMATSSKEFQNGIDLFTRMGHAESLDKWKTEHFPCDDTSALPGFITSYHIDTELGLYIFAETLRKHQLI